VKAIPAKEEAKNGPGKAIGQKYFDDSDDDLGDEEIEDVPEENSSDEESAVLKQLKKKTLAVVDHTKVTYIPFKKNFYIEVPEIARMTPEEVSHNF
jgi:ATP-dependent RNA helicase DDX46/PRP5